MESLRLFAPHDLRLVDEPVPEPEPGEVLVRISAAGICGSDLHWYAEGGIGDSRLKKPHVLGHELAGVIDSGPRRGQRVAVDPAVPCGACRFCLEGNPNFCERLRFAGDGTTEGGFRQLIAWPERCLVPLPETLSAVDGALLEPLGVALHALNLGHLQTGMRVGVFGCGPIGLLLVQLACRMALGQVVATEVLPHRIDDAQASGATPVVDARDPERLRQIETATQGLGLDVVFEAAGEDAAVADAVAASRPGAKVILVGIPASDQTSFQASTARRKGLTFKLVRRMKHTYPRAIELVRRGQIDLGGLATHRYPLSEYEKAFAAAERREGLKVVLEPGG